METGAFLCMVLYLSRHGNRCPYLHADHLGIDEKLSRVDALWSCLHLFQVAVLGIPSQTVLELSTSAHVTARDVTGAVYDL